MWGKPERQWGTAERVGGRGGVPTAQWNRGGGTVGPKERRRRVRGRGQRGGGMAGRMRATGARGKQEKR